jgi:hypothetical protein
MSADPHAPPAPPPQSGINVENAENVNAAAPLDQPSAPTRDWIWKLTTGTFCLGIVALVGALIVAMFLRPVSETTVGLVHGIALLLIGYVAGLMQRGPQHA